MTEKSPSTRIRKWPAAVLIFSLAFVSFYSSAYFSSGYRGILGYETKDTLTSLQSYFSSIRQGATLYWDPVYLQYTPRWPQAPIGSPVTLFFVLLARWRIVSSLEGLMPFYLAVLALIQIGCALTMYCLLRRSGFGFWPGVIGGLVYAYNHQTLAFGIIHGYERISAVLLAPLFILAFFRFLESPPGSPRRRLYGAGAALLIGLSLVSNGDVKPTAFFCFFLVIAAVFHRPFRWGNLLSLFLVFILAAGIFAFQGLPTLYSLPEGERGEEPVEEMMDYSLPPGNLLSTHFWTGFTGRPDYPWENTAEFSMTMMPLVVLGLFFLRRHRWRNIFLAALVFSLLWMTGKHLPTAPLQGWLMRLTAIRHPNRIAILLYFVYGFLAAAGLQGLIERGIRRSWPAVGLLIIPAAMMALRISGAGAVPVRYIACSLFACLMLGAIGRRLLPASASVWIVVFFLLERTTVLRTPEETTITDPTAYCTFDEIYRHHPRVEAILADPEHRRWRTFFAAKEYPDLHSHNLYLNAFVDGIRPIFPYLYLDEKSRRVSEVQEVIFRDWSHPMWDLLNVKYFVDLEGYFDLWDEEDTSRVGLESLVRVDEHVRVNPRAEDEIFVRYGRHPVESDGWFLEGLSAGRLDLENTAYLDEIDPGIPFPQTIPEAGEGIEVLERKPDGVTARVDLARPGVLVFSEFWFWPWRVTVDGEDRPLRRAYHILQAVELEEGEHQVRFYFHSRHPAFLIPALVSIGLIIILGFYCLIQYRRMKSLPRRISTAR